MIENKFKRIEISMNLYYQLILKIKSQQDWIYRSLKS